MKAHDLIHGGLYLLGDSQVVRFYALNGYFYALDRQCVAGRPFVNMDSGELKIQLVNDKWVKISPIPLTAEILKRNGFKNVRTYEWREGINVTRWRLYTENLEDMIEVLHAPKYDGFSWKGNDVNAVHQLQRVFHLCGLTELADNFKVE